MKTHIKKEQYLFHCGRRPGEFLEESKNLGSTTCARCKSEKTKELEIHYILTSDKEAPAGDQ